MMRRPCEHCGQMFSPEKPTRRFCSRKCSGASRPKDFYSAIGTKGMETRNPKRAKAVVAKYRALCEQLEPWAAFRLGWTLRRKSQRSTNDSRAYRRGYSDGYEQASKVLHPWKVA